MTPAPVIPPGAPMLLMRTPGPWFENLTAVGSNLFFTLDDGVHGYELWMSDGTAAGTSMVKDICPGSVSSRACNLSAAGNLLLFMADDGTHGMEIWRSDGTPSGTVMVKDIFPGAGDGAVPIIGYGSRVVLKSELYFRGTDGGSNWGIWKSDGTEPGTVFLANAVPGGGTIPLPFFVVSGETVYFLASDPAHGEELWKSNGTPETTVLVKDIYPGPVGCSPASLTPFKNGVYFTAHSATSGGLWKSNGTKAGTKLLDLNLTGAGALPSNLAVAGSVLYFVTLSGNDPMWRTDGTAAGTFEIQPLPAQAAPGFRADPNSFMPIGSTLFFNALDNNLYTELWKTDGTLAGTVRVKDINPGNPGSSPGMLTPVGSLLFFGADDGTHGWEIWWSDGTEAQTSMLMDLLPGAGTSSPSHLTAVGSSLYWTADDGLGLGLWRTSP